MVENRRNHLPLLLALLDPTHQRYFYTNQSTASLISIRCAIDELSKVGEIPEVPEFFPESGLNRLLSRVTATMRWCGPT
ncbi:unnamed protein product, partial [Sphenostylis stenocarpa]